MARPFAVLILLVGLALFLGFGWLGIDAVLDTYAFPEQPSETTLPELARLGGERRGTWVRLVGDFEVEAGPVQPNEGGPHYLLLRGEQQRLIVTFEPLEHPQALNERAWSGVPTIHRTRASSSSYRRLPHELAFKGVDWAHFGEPRVVILWTHSGPQDSRIGSVLGPLFALLGAFVVWMALGNLRRPAKTMDAIWPEAALPKSIRMSAFAGAQARLYARILLGAGLFWLLGFGSLELSKGQPGLRAAAPLAVGVLLVFLAGALFLRARRVSGHEYFAALVWLPVRRTFSVRSEGFATGVQAYEIDMPAGTKPSTLTVHSSPTHGGFVFRDASRSAILAARPLQSSEVLILSSSLREIRENPLAPMAHPRHRLLKLG